MNWRTYYIAVATMVIFLTGAVSHAQEEKGSFHHIHLNAVDPSKTIAYYKRYFSGVPVKFRDVADAVLVDRAFLLMTKVDSPAPSDLTSAIYHIGWGGVDGPSDFAWRDKEGMKWETPLRSLGPNHYMYAYGPDKEVVEVWTGFHHHRFGHVHLLSDEVNVAKNWYMKYLNLNGPATDTKKPPKAPADLNLEDSGVSIFRYLWASAVTTDNGVTINIFGKPSTESVVWWNYGPLGDLVKTDGRNIDHIAFSFRDIDPVFKKMKAGGVEIVDPIKQRAEYNMKSFFVRGPDNILIEVVQGKPFPEGVWE